MPVIGIQTDLLQRCLGHEIEPSALMEHLTHLGCDVEGMATLSRFGCSRCGNIVEITETQDPPVVCDRCGVDYRQQPELQQALGEVEVIRMELLAVRPDMFDPGGLARVLRAYLGYKPLPPLANLAVSGVEVLVDPIMGSDTCPRPAIACAVVRNLELSDDLIKVVMKLQENLHWALGRDRKHASIGVYDLDRMNCARPLRYRAVEPDALRFVPLGYDPLDPSAAITPRQVLQEHPKGVAFARLLAGWQRYPLLQDADDRVLSMPPIINSEGTRVSGQTHNFLIDVTGTGRRIVSRALNVLVTSLKALAPQARVETVLLRYPDGGWTTPDLTPQQMELDPDTTAALLGIPLARADIRALLERMGHTVYELEGSARLRVMVPAYRNDILHARDLMEDVAIAYGYHNITPSLVPTFTVGAPLPVEEQSVLARQAMTGLGFHEVMTLHLTSPETAFDAMGLARHDAHVLIENPISVNETMTRLSLLPGLLQILQVNTHRELPQRVFEVGDTTTLDKTAETGTAEVRKAAGALTDSAAGFADLRPVVEALLAELGWALATEPLDCGSYLSGRAASVIAVRDHQRLVIGELGEVHPQVLDAFRLRHPVAAFEVRLDALAL